MIRQLASAFCAALALGCAAAPPKEYSDERITIGDTPQPYFVRKTTSPKEYTTPQRLPQDGIYYHGLVDEDGREIVPLDWGWVGIELINASWATGKRWQDPTFKIVRLPDGKVEETPYVGYGWYSYFDSPVKHIHMISRPRWEENRFDLTFLDAAGRPARDYKDLGGPTVSSQGLVTHRLFRAIGPRLLCLDTTMPDGSAVSQLFSFDGLPVTPILPRITPFGYLYAYREAEASGRQTWQSVAHGFENAWAVGDLKDPGLPDSRIWQPVSPDGLPLALPEGALGMTPLSWKKQHDYNRKLDLTVHSGWAIIYPTAAGVQYAVGTGTAPEVLARAATLPRYDGLRQVRTYVDESHSFRGLDSPLLAVRKSGQPSWELVVTDTFASVYAAPEGEVLASADALLARWERHKKELGAKLAEEARKKEAAEAERRRMEREIFLSWARPYLQNVMNGTERPGGRLWTLTGVAKDLGWLSSYRDFVSRKIQEETLKPTPEAKFWISESRELGLRDHRALVDKLEADAAQARQKEWERQRVEAENAAKFSRAWEESRVSGNAQSPNPAMAGYTDTYKRNLEAWNQGRLNWFTPTHLKGR